VAVGEAKVSTVDVRDNAAAAAAAAALTGEGHAGKTYTLTGPEALSHAELTAELSNALSRAITFVDVPPRRCARRCLTRRCRPGRRLV